MGYLAPKRCVGEGRMSLLGVCALVLSGFVLLYIVKFWVFRRPQPKSKLVSLVGEGTIPESVEGAHETSERWCIIGAGFSGLTMASKFQQENVPFTIFERESSLGGNWNVGV